MLVSHFQHLIVSFISVSQQSIMKISYNYYKVTNKELCCMPVTVHCVSPFTVCNFFSWVSNVTLCKLSHSLLL